MKYLFKIINLSNSRIAGVYMRLKSAGRLFDSVGLHQHGCLAHWEVQRIHIPQVAGSNPAAATIYSTVAQLVERKAVNFDVAGSGPACGAILLRNRLAGRASDFGSDRTGSKPVSASIPVSSNGRTSRSGRDYQGSNPWAGSKVNLGVVEGYTVIRWPVKPLQVSATLTGHP